MEEALIAVQECGDSGLIVYAESSDRIAAWTCIHNLSDCLWMIEPDGLRGLIPTYDRILVEFDCSVVDYDVLRDRILAVARGSDLTRARPTPHTFEVPVVYGGTHGPDLAYVAGHLGTTESKVVEVHSSGPLIVRCLGAPAGSPMMDGPPFEKSIPRLASPRLSVPSGSVAVAGRQAVVSPTPSPGGWAVIGRTPLQIIDITADPLVPYRPGDVFRFVPIQADDWDHYSGPLQAAVA